MITVNQTPQDNTPVYNDMVFHVVSTQTTQPNFRYICDVYVNGNNVERLKRFAHPTLGVAVFDIHDIVEPYLSYDLNALDSTEGTMENENSFVTFFCKFGEEFGDDSTGVTVYPDLTTTSSQYGWNGSFPFKEFVDFDYTDYLLANGGFLTNMPSPVTIYEDQPQFLHSLTASNNFAMIEIKTYDQEGAGGTLLGTFRITNNNNSAATLSEDKFLTIVAGWNLNSVDNANFSLGSQPVLTDSVKSYTIGAYTGGGSLHGSLHLFNVGECKGTEEGATLLFQTNYGGFETFKFSAARREQVDVTRKEYKKNIGTTSATEYTISKQDRGRVSYFTSSEEKWTLISDWFDDSYIDWLQQLTESPQVYLIDTDNITLISVNIDSPTFQRVRQINQQLINLTLNISFSFNNYRQRY
jgi:hypothetical protein